MVDILHRVGIRASCDEVFKALSTRDGLAGWWTHDTRLQPHGGFSFHFHANGAEVGSFEMKVLELDPARRVLWQVAAGPEEWVGTRVVWDLQSEGDWCIVLFKHQGWKAPVEFMHHCSTKWAIFLMSLKSLVETGKGLPSPHDVKIDNWN